MKQNIIAPLIYAILLIYPSISTQHFFTLPEKEEEYIPNEDPQPQPAQPDPQPGPSVDHDKVSEAAESEYTLNGTITSTETLSNIEITTSENDTSIVKSTSGASLIIKSNTTLRKTGGPSSDTEYSEFYGVNAGILCTKSSSIIIENIDIVTNASGSNAVFATGENATITINGGEIYTHNERSSRGLDATYEGTINAYDVLIETDGGSCATLATDRGEGTVTCTNCDLTTNGIGSPIIYSTGAISLIDSTGKATQSQLVVVEGKNSAKITGSTCTAVGTGQRGEDDSCGVMIYQSQSGDADTGKGYFTCENSDLKVVEGSQYYSKLPFFFITNTIAEIKTTNCNFEYGSGILIALNGTQQWGTTGSNGGGATLYVYDQTIQGDIVADSLSNLTLVMKNSTFIGAINKYKEAGKISVTLDENSILNLTCDSYVHELDNADSTGANIVGEGKLTKITSSKIKGWAVALIAIACVVVVVVIIFIILRCRKKSIEGAVEGVTTELKADHE